MSVRRELAGIFHDILGEGGRKKKDLNVLGEHAIKFQRFVGKLQLGGDLLLDPKALVPESLLIQHVVSLIKDKDAELRDIQLSASNDIHHCTWSTDNDTSSDGFSARECARDRSSNLLILDKATYGVNNSFNLSRQFSARCKSKSLGLVRFAEVNSRQYRGHKGSGFASARLRLRQHVSRRIAKHQRKRSSLYLGGLQEVKAEESLQNILTAEIEMSVMFLPE
jgi:hypothetical protein